MPKMLSHRGAIICRNTIVFMINKDYKTMVIFKKLHNLNFFTIISFQFLYSVKIPDFNHCFYFYTLTHHGGFCLCTMLSYNRGILCWKPTSLMSTAYHSFHKLFLYVTYMIHLTSMMSF